MFQLKYNSETIVFETKFWLKNIESANESVMPVCISHYICRILHIEII